MQDLDMSNVLDDAANDPTLDRVCDNPLNCADDDCPLIHADYLDGGAMGTFAVDEIATYDDKRDNPDWDETLGPCGCTDYHMADCPLRTGGSTSDPADDYDSEMMSGYWDEESDWG